MTDYHGVNIDIEPPRLPRYQHPVSNEPGMLQDDPPRRWPNRPAKGALDRAEVWQIVASGEFTNAQEKAKYQNTSEYVSKHPKCSLNVVCFRGGATGCEFHQVQTVLESRFESKEVFQRTIMAIPSLIYSDAELCHALRDVYQNKMCGFWRKALFLKTLRGIRLLSFTSTSRMTVVPLNDFVLQELPYAYQNPSKITSEHEWIDWVFRLRRPGRRHALEFVKGWSGTRIAVAGAAVLVISTVVGVVWSVKGSGIQDGFAIAGFILTSGSVLLALLAIVSQIESSSGKQND